jgi:UDP-N-acetyl-D-galactosamine dehydrogenase
MNPSIAIIGLGYVGFPLAVEFGKLYPTLGFDIDASRIAELNRGYDRTQEVSDSQLIACSQMRFSS